MGETKARGPEARVITVGDELLAGIILDRHLATIAGRLAPYGITIGGAATVPDDAEAIAAAVRSAAAAGDCVLVTGGLGPTVDDRTTDAVAAAFGRPLERDEDQAQRLRDFFASLGRDMPESNLKQADRPQGARWLPNPNGTAPGFTLAADSGTPIFVLPGPPRELHPMLDDHVLPALVQRFSASPRPRRRYRMLGRGESSVVQALEPVWASAAWRPFADRVRLHFLPRTPEIWFDIEWWSAAADAPPPEAWRALDGEIRGAIGPALYGIGKAGLAERLVAELRASSERVAFAESCTAGLAAARLADVPGCSDVLLGGVVAYDNRIKTEVLGVPAEILAAHGAVSEPTVRAMASGVCARLGAELGVAISGVAGPGGGSEDKPVGTVDFAVAHRGETSNRRLKLRGDRATVRQSAALWAHKLAWDRVTALDPARITELD